MNIAVDTVVGLAALAAFIQGIARPLWGILRAAEDVVDRLELVEDAVIVLLEDTGDRRNAGIARRLRERRAERHAS